ncbi:hypothetical protein ACGFMK_16110 [Amycolatopsis sp. NPDC049252]|uniref:hypothetical protein n=1 Tax=Amycolatopsis sp. NPDC049252 TaxID=3363933 RepID=UPI00370FE17F
MAQNDRKSSKNVAQYELGADLEPRIEHPAPKLLMPAYPTFDVGVLRVLFENLDEPWYDEQHRFMLRRYRSMRQFWLFMEVLLTSAIVVLSTAGILTVLLLVTGGFTLSTAVAVIVVFFVANLLQSKRDHGPIPRSSAAAGHGSHRRPPLRACCV